MSETDNLPGGGPITQGFAAAFLRPLSARELRLRRLYTILFFILFIVNVIVLFVPALSQWRLWPGVTMHDAMQTLLYLIAGAWLLRLFIPIYWRICRMPPRAWWQRFIPLGALLAVVGLGGAGVVALIHTRLGDAVGVPLYVSGLALCGVGVLVYLIGHVGLIRVMLREQRAARGAQGQTR